MPRTKKTEDKYQAQRKWQEKNGYMSKSYRLHEDIKNKITTFSQKKNISQAKILNKALILYKEGLKDKMYVEEFEAAYKNIVANSRVSFKIKRELTEEIAEICEKAGYNQGRFVSAIILVLMNKE